MDIEHSCTTDEGEIRKLSRFSEAGVCRQADTKIAMDGDIP